MWFYKYAKNYQTAMCKLNDYYKLYFYLFYNKISAKETFWSYGIKNEMVDLPETQTGQNQKLRKVEGTATSWSHTKRWK